MDTKENNAKLLINSGMSKELIKKEIAEKLKEYSGLIDEETAMILMVKEKGLMPDVEDYAPNDILKTVQNDFARFNKEALTDFQISDSQAQSLFQQYTIHSFKEPEVFIMKLVEVKSNITFHSGVMNGKKGDLWKCLILKPNYKTVLKEIIFPFQALKTWVNNLGFNVHSQNTLMVSYQGKKEKDGIIFHSCFCQLVNRGKLLPLPEKEIEEPVNEMPENTEDIKK